VNLQAIIANAEPQLAVPLQLILLLRRTALRSAAANSERIKIPHWFGTARLRFGFTPNLQTSPYATGGPTYADVA
jgi:opacity protein-like surface antigen